MQATHGTLEVGKAADFALWESTRPQELAYAIGANPCVASCAAAILYLVRNYFAIER